MMVSYEAIKEFVDKSGVKINTMAEIGVYRGEASEHFASYWPHAILYLVDPWVPYDPGRGLHTLDRFSSSEAQDGFHREVCEKFKLNKNVIIWRTTSLDASIRIGNCMFDLVFIDADHSYESVKQDIGLWIPKVRSGGILCGHDYGHPWKGVIRAVNESIRNPLSIGGSVWATFV